MWDWVETAVNKFVFFFRFQRPARAEERRGGNLVQPEVSQIPQRRQIGSRRWRLLETVSVSHKYRVNLTFIFHRSLCNERRAGTCTCTIARSSHWPGAQVSSLTRHLSHQLTQTFKSSEQPGVQVSSATTRSSLCTRVSVVDSA